MTDATLPQTGSLELALANGLQLVDSDPTAAAEQAREILSKNEHNGDALRLLAKALRRLGESKEAERVEILAIQAAAYNPTLVSAGQAILANRLAEAEQLVRPYLDQRPDDAAALRLLAELAFRAGELPEAARLLRRALELAPAFTAARLRLAKILYLQNKVAESLAMLDASLEFEPTSAAAQGSRASTLARIGDYGEAIGLYEQLLQKSPDNIRVWISYGQVLNTVGRFEESIAAYRRVIELEPNHGEAWWSLANLKTSRFGEADIEAMARAVEATETDSDRRLHIHFALGKALEDAGRYGEAFDHYSAGNAIREKGCEYRPEDIQELVDGTIAVFTKEFFDARTGFGADDTDPIFVIGLPRAGSTLVEQILASHSMIEGTSELPQVPMIRQSLKAGDPQNLATAVSQLDRSELRRLGEDYIANTRPHRKTDKPHFIDKLPNNWENLGLILSILPNAKIVDARRHPMDCCFSNFKQLFAHGQLFTYSLDWIGRYYSDYVRSMDHFDRLFPGRIHRVIHEELIEHPDREIRDMLDYLGVPFEESCLRFYENDRAVRTPSAQQVRRPLNREGMNRWRPFEPWLSELKEALGPVLDCYPAVPPDLS